MVKTCKITRIAVCAAILFVSQVSLASIPNCELVSLLTVVFTFSFGKEMYLAVTVFTLLEGCLYGFGDWVLMYFYLWPLLVTVTLVAKRFVGKDIVCWTVLLGLWGLSFGTLCSIVYLPISYSYAFSYWLSGLPWDVTHCIGNIVLSLVLFNPLSKISCLVTRRHLGEL